MNREGKAKKGLSIYVLCAIIGVVLILLFLFVTAALLSQGHIGTQAAKAMSTGGALLGAAVAGHITARLYRGKQVVRGACTGGLMLILTLALCVSATVKTDISAVIRLILAIIGGACTGSLLLSYKKERKKRRKRNK